jgi:DNA topoisomerase-2
MSKKTIEEKYQKLTQREHVILRSGMYIGQIKKHMGELWVPKGDENKMEKTMVEYSPGFMKIFDEVLTNATDHSFRTTLKVPVKQIKIEYSQETGEISVWNDGDGVPVELHAEHNIYVPELIFGHLLSGSNYDDSTARTGAGTNGIGSKTTNIFSKKFTVETIDSNTKKKFVQEHSENMTQKTKAKITSNSGKSYTKISFVPDYEKFEMNGLEDDTILLIKKRAIDTIACTNNNIQVFLNGEKLKGKGLVDYTKFFFEESKVFSESFQERIKSKGSTEFTEYIWEYAIVPYSQYEQMSFVNGNATIQGGKHVDYIMYQIVNKLKVMIETKKKLKELKPNFIKDKLFLFLRATVANPTFNSQTKEQLTTISKDFGCSVTVSDKFIEKLYKSSITEEIVDFCKAKENVALAKTTDGKKTNKVYIPKLDDAIWAGTAKSDQCTLILTEGDSAATFAKWGRAVVGVEKWAIFPLKGKVLNVRDATIAQLIGNEEINNLKQIIGLKQDVNYTDTKNLRYGKVMILTDADQDGSHIKGLLINFFHAQWPSLVKLNFIQTLKTPIVKAIKGKKVLEFFTEQDYHKWKETVNPSSFQIKYFKGLGTSKKEDAKDTFNRLTELKIDYYYKDKKCDDSILLAFDKDKNNKTKIKKNDEEDDESTASETILKCTDRRKEWLSNYNKDIYINVKTNKISYQDLINKELIHFSIYDNLRSIPSICDGLKPSQRKIMYYMLKKNINKPIKVAQLSGYVSAECGYHHGEASLQGAIVGLAQDFVGSNNINLLYPDGAFGSRFMCGKDAASPRYIFTQLSQITPFIFNSNDTPLLNFLDDDGSPIEPEWYLPILPMVLVNGCSGIGTGYSTNIPCYNPKDIIANLLRVLEDDVDPLPMKPYFKGFHGYVEEIEKGSYMTKGKWVKLSDTQVKITEIPIGTGVTTYKEFLESLIKNNVSVKRGDTKVTKNKVRKIVLKDVQNKTIDENDSICFIIEFESADTLDLLIKNNTLESELKLIKKFNTNNMYLFNEKLILTKFSTPEEILLKFYDLRIEYYQQRKEYLEKKLSEELVILKAKMRFIKQYINKELDINRKSKQFIVDLFKSKKYPLHEESYDYLLTLPVYSFTSEKIELLNTQCDKKQSELKYLQSKSNTDLWTDDLTELMKKL